MLRPLSVSLPVSFEDMDAACLPMQVRNHIGLPEQAACSSRVSKYRLLKSLPAEGPDSEVSIKPHNASLQLCLLHDYINLGITHIQTLIISLDKALHPVI